MAYLLLALAQVTGLLLIPFGLPGLWVQVLALTAYAWATGFVTVGFVPLALTLSLAGAGELAEWLLGGHYARCYGGGRPAVWGAILGGTAGAFAGLPVPLLGSVLGAFLGSFAGAALFELLAGRGTTPALRAGWGAFVGRLVATALKAGIGVSIAAIALLAALR